MKFLSACVSTRLNGNLSGLAVLASVLLFPVLIAACSSHPQGPPRDGILKADEFAGVLVDMHYYDGVFAVTGGSSYMSQSEADSLDFYREVLEKHGIGREEFRKTLTYYSYNPEQFEEIYNRVMDELSRKLAEAEMEESDPSLPEQPDPEPVNLWTLKEEWSFPGDDTNRVIYFDIPVPGPGEYTFSAGIRVEPEDPALNPRVNIWFWYDDGTDEGYRENFRMRTLPKDGRVRKVTLSRTLSNPEITHIRGKVLDHTTPGGVGHRRAEVEDIRLFRKVQPGMQPGVRPR